MKKNGLNWNRQSESTILINRVNEDDDFSPSTDYEINWNDIDFDEVRDKRNQLLEHIRLRTTTPWDRLHRHLQWFKLTPAAFSAVADGVRDDIGRGLQANMHHPGYWLPQVSSFRMIDTFIADLPSGSEYGIAYSIHIDTQRVRITRADFHPHDHRATRLSDRHWPMSSVGLNSSSVSATTFFDALAEMLCQVMDDSGDLIETNGSRPIYPLCLCAAFPVLQQALDSVILIEWAGNMEAGRDVPQDPIEGTDICAGLRDALDRSQLPITLVAYANDTVSTLCTAAYEYGFSDSVVRYECLLAVVVSAGINACYREMNAKAHYGFQGTILDLECANLNRGLPLTPVDYELDFSRPQTQGYNLLEKMMAMGYVGEVARRSLISILQDSIPAQAWQENSLTVQHVIAIADDVSVGNDRTRTVIEEAWGRMPSLAPHQCPSSAKWDWDDSTHRQWRPLYSDTELIHRCCWAVVDRCAALTAAVMIGIAGHTGHLRPETASLLKQRRLGFVVGGPFTEICETFREQLRHWLAAGCCQTGNTRPPIGIDIIDVNHTDGRGLALIAASQKNFAQ